MGFLDCSANFLVFFGSAKSSFVSQTLIPHGVLPVSMALGYFILGSTFPKMQILGAIFVLFGAVTSSFSFPAGVLLFCSNVPLALSGIVKELVLLHKSRELPISYLNTVVSCLQFLIGFIIAPLTGIAPGQLSSQLREGYHCLIGTSAQCETGSVPEFMAFCGFLFLTNVSLILLVKHGNSSIMYAASTLVLPLSNFVAIFPLFLGPYAASIEPVSIVALFSVMIGISIYCNANHPPHVVHPEADDATVLGKDFIAPGEQFFAINRFSSDISLLVPPRGLVGGLGIPPWMPIVHEKSLLAKWSVTAHGRQGGLESPLLKRPRGIWIPSGRGPGSQREEKEGEGFFEWGMHVEDFSSTLKKTRIIEPV